MNRVPLSCGSVSEPDWRQSSVPPEVTLWPEKLVPKPTLPAFMSTVSLGAAAAGPAMAAAASAATAEAAARMRLIRMSVSPFVMGLSVGGHPHRQGQAERRTDTPAAEDQSLAARR